MQYQEALDWIHSIQPYGMNQGLERIQALLERVGSPQKNLKFIHIGGTNGKGSVASYCASILRANGYRTGLYTSPYLEQFTNRIAVDGDDIPENLLSELATQLRPHVEAVACIPGMGHPTEFEVVTALALMYYHQVQPDVVVWEVGLGGRLDATNVIDPPIATVITPIDFDHMQILGETIKEIAGEKAAIIKRGSTLVCSPQLKEAADVLTEQCRNQKVPMAAAGTDYTWEYVSNNLTGQTFNYYGTAWNLKGLEISLLGKHQVENAATAVAVMETLAAAGIIIDESSLRRGLKSARWPGRLEIMGQNPLVVIDGAHNPGAMKRLREALQEQFTYHRLILLLGILGDKDMKRILSIIAPLADYIVVTRALSPRTAAPGDVAGLIREIVQVPVSVQEDISAAVKTAVSSAGPSDLVCCAGSLYLISEVRRILNK